jgi:hypothetical protein
MEQTSERRDGTAARVEDGKFRVPVWMLAALLAAATLAVYYPAIRNGFVDELASTDVDFTHGGLPVFWIEPNWDHAVSVLPHEINAALVERSSISIHS